MASKGRSTANKHSAEYGKGAHQIDTPEYMLSPQAMIAYLRQTLTSPTYRAPVLPSVAVELMRLTRLPQVRMADVRQVLERDSLLAAKVLQLTQSALYSRGTPIRSLDEAISLLGLRTLEDLFLQTVVSMRIFRASGYEAPMANLMRHSMLTAHIARMACRLTAIPDEFAFMCGLLHDVGMAAGLLIFADADKQRAARGEPSPFEEVAFALQVVHEEASVILADAWGLHPEIRLVLGIHHRMKVAQRIHPLAAVLCVADWIAAESGTAIGTESDASQGEEAARYLGFSKKTLDSLGARARELMELEDTVPASASRRGPGGNVGRDGLG